jgi:NAD(P)-dependent dehydrogenase (short-subunit alcohol dehydrogenase family)
MLNVIQRSDIDALKAEVDFTVTSPILLIRAFLPLIRKAPTKKILIISSILASIESAANMPGLANGYSVARAALNMVVRKWSATLRLEGIIAAMIHPGWVLTEIGDQISGWMATYAPTHAPISMEEAAEGVVKVLQGLSVVDAGAFLDHHGNSIPF